jgi:hypothetical protein
MKTPREHFLNQELKRRVGVLADVAREYDAMVDEYFRLEEGQTPRYDATDIDEQLVQLLSRADDISYIVKRIHEERHRK